MALITTTTLHHSDYTALVPSARPEFPPRATQPAIIGGVDYSDRHFDRIISVSAVVLMRSDGAVITVRKRGTDRFMLPGGKWETGETPLECAVREVGEELGVTLAPDSLSRVGRFESATANEPGFLLVSEVFIAECDSPAVPAAEIAEARWLTTEEISALAELAEDAFAPWAPLLVRVAREVLVAGGIQPQ